MAEKVVVIGSGPAGLMAGISAAKQGREVLVLEFLPDIGRKLLASGAGKCNFTNMLDAESMAERYAPEQRRFVKPALLSFTPDNVRDFFAGQGVKYKLVDDFYCFPVSEKASDILQVLLDRLTFYGARVLCNTPVSGLKIENERICGVYSHEKFFPCDYLIAAAGGPGFPRLGGHASLDKLFAANNITVLDRTPALCGIKSNDLWLNGLAGIVLDKTVLTLDKKNFAQGTLLFTGDGISGPAALDMSGRAAIALRDGKKVVLRLNIAPEKNRSDWQELLEKARQENGKKLIRNLFNHHLPQAVASAITQAAGAGEMIAANLSKTVQERLLEYLTNAPINVSGVESWEKAMASTGGVDRSKINSKTMQSKEIANLYLAGEFIDVDAPCGGYNIQWAFSSGYLAGLLK
ncbi:MAG: aminoacetone oxidase family FAD-binding enzyme [Lentisphaeria bacterium]|nr:aminoacetone oxidase family FAD-binding enzyme [Lentisphaeria bacterium]MBR7144730.1 aminoacetone oxidase family FAD-binding enzyme [Lentisphaeria bacterium]